jgi:mannose-6-phosphate isomerase-like protein (cupin superfamily)
MARFICNIICLWICVSASVIAQDTGKIKPKLITLNLDSSNYQSIFKGSPETVSMHSGLVTLKPGETVGDHNTDDYEEMLVVFSGKGQMTFNNNQIFNLKYGIIAYCPPHTEHDVKNIGIIPLKYLYIATKTK